MAKRFEIFEGFQKFHTENPWIFNEYRDLATELYASGRRHYSSDALIHVLRFRCDIQTNSKDFKIPNNFTAYYARMLAVVEPIKFEEFFTLKMADKSDLNYISDRDFKCIYQNIPVTKNLQTELF